MHRQLCVHVTVALIHSRALLVSSFAVRCALSASLELNDLVLLSHIRSCGQLGEAWHGMMAWHGMARPSLVTLVTADRPYAQWSPKTETYG